MRLLSDRQRRRHQVGWRRRSGMLDRSVQTHLLWAGRDNESYIRSRRKALDRYRLLLAAWRSGLEVVRR